MPMTLQIMRKRDNKERDLRSYQMAISLVDVDAHNRKEEFALKVSNYQEWKKENSIEGIQF